jgi:hypothetical protein
VEDIPRNFAFVAWPVEASGRGEKCQQPMTIKMKIKMMDRRTLHSPSKQSDRSRNTKLMRDPNSKTDTSPWMATPEWMMTL